MFRYDARHLTAVSSVLKERFPNLRVAETIKLTTEILDAVKEADSESSDAAVLLTSSTDLTISYVQAVNIERANRWHGGNFREWSALEWAGAMCGEAGEAANVAKKLRRIETGAAGNAWSDRPLDADGLIFAMKKECADTFLYLTLLASRCGINLAAAVREVFNKKSDEMGFPERI